MASALFLAGCASGPERIVDESQGPLSANARNQIVRQDPEALANVALGFERSGNISGAKSLYDQAFAAEPTLLPAQLGRARLTMFSGELEQGRQMYDEIIKARPYSLEARMDYANSLLNLGLVDEAAALYLPVMDIPNIPKTDRLYLMAARLYAAKSDMNNANKYIVLSGLFDKKDAAAINLQALIFALSNDYAAAVASLQPIINQPGLRTNARQTLATIYALSGQMDAARAIAEAALPIDEARLFMRMLNFLKDMSAAEQAETVILGRVPNAVRSRLLAEKDANN